MQTAPPQLAPPQPAPQKISLHIGINYGGSPHELRGCHHDARALAELYASRGYEASVLVDDGAGPAPTRKNILAALFAVVLSGAPDIAITYSGHGAQVADLSADEADGVDECICPADFAALPAAARMITDDHLRAMMAFAPAGAAVAVVLDCCHSGSGMDLAFNLFVRGSGAAAKLALVRDPARALTDARVCLLSGCQDAQTSADALIDGVHRGALTWALLRQLQSPSAHLSAHSPTHLSAHLPTHLSAHLPAPALLELVRRVRADLAAAKYAQLPMLSTSFEQ